MEQKASYESWTSVLLPLALILGLVLLLSLNPGHQAGAEGMPSNGLEPWLRLFASYLNLGAIVRLRTLLNYSLEREIRMVDKRRASD